MQMRIVLLGVLFAACQPAIPGDSPQSFIEKPRLLSIRSTPPSVQPGHTVQLEALQVDPTGGATPLMQIWMLCDPPTPAVPSSPCLRSETLDNIAAVLKGEVPGIHVATGLTATYVAPADAYQGVTDLSSAHPEAVAVLLLETASDLSQIGPGAIRQALIKSIPLVPPGAPEGQNPDFAEVDIDGVPQTDSNAAGPRPTMSFSARAAAGAAGTPTFSWYATGGRFDASTNLQVRTLAGQSARLQYAPAFPFDVFVILHDDLGTTWRSLRVQ